MADNLNVSSNPPAPTAPVATEDVGGGLQMQRVKLVTGALHVDGGDVTPANPLPVTGRPTTNVFADGATGQTTAATVTSYTIASPVLLEIQVFADPANLRPIWIATSNAVAGGNGVMLVPGLPVTLPLKGTVTLYFWSDTTGETWYLGAI